MARGNPYWLEDEPVPRAAPRHEGRVDVAIVGAGITGCSAALRLADAGLRVRVHDQRAVAEGASGRNGGFALRGGASRYDVARETYGREHAYGMWTWTERAPGRGQRRLRDRRRRPRARAGARRRDLADPRAGDRERADRPDAVRPSALRAPGLRLLAAAAKRPRSARGLPRRVDPRRADRRRGDD